MAAVGQDIEALCGRCGTVWHVVMAMMGDRIAKVVCKRCNGHHRYRTENEVVEAPGEAPARGARRPTASRRYSRTSAPAPAPLPPFDPNKAPRVYTAKDVYDTGERVAHPTFGTGIVTGAAAPGRVDVAFPSGARVLACAKTVSTLARPVAVTVPISDRPPDSSK
ncbi:MAG: hypothetical protein JWM82_1557 [Myxococcales bacterium]|jgi:hypothetical protein|nr:hypothetical protein [Myxococcales bacterium]